MASNKKTPATTTMSYRELISQSKEQREAGSLERSVVEGSFAMQKAIVNAEQQVAIQKIAVNQAEVTLAEVTATAVANNLSVRQNIPFKASRIIEELQNGKVAVTRAEDALAFAQQVLADYQEQLELLQNTQAELFPTV